MANEYKELLSNQQEYFKSGATRSITFRKKQLKKLKSVLRENEETMMEAIYDDFKKSSFDTFTNESTRYLPK